MTIKVLGASAENIYSQGIRARLLEEKKLELLDRSGDEEELFASYALHQPDVVLISGSFHGFNTIELIRRFISRNPKANVVVLTESCHPHLVSRMLDAGARGFVSGRSTTFPELVRAIETAAQSKVYVCQSASTAYQECNGETKTESHNAPCLSEREKQVLRLVTDGLSSKAIAKLINIAPSTVDVHRRNIMYKIGSNNIASLTRYALLNGMACL